MKANFTETGGTVKAELGGTDVTLVAGAKVEYGVLAEATVGLKDPIPPTSTSDQNKKSNNRSGIYC